MQVSIELLGQTQPLLFQKVQDTYQRGGMYCLQMLDGTIHKFPLQNIHQVTEYHSIDMPAKK